MNKKINYFFIPALALILIVTSGCSAPKPAGLSDEQVTGMTENSLKALEANDYKTFTQDFSEQMNAAFTQEQFTRLQVHAANGQRKICLHRQTDPDQ